MGSVILSARVCTLIILEGLCEDRYPGFWLWNTSIWKEIFNTFTVCKSVHVSVNVGSYLYARTHTHKHTPTNTHPHKHVLLLFCCNCYFWTFPISNWYSINKIYFIESYRCNLMIDGFFQVISPTEEIKNKCVYMQLNCNIHFQYMTYFGWDLGNSYWQDNLYIETLTSWRMSIVQVETYIWGCRRQVNETI